MYVIYNIESTSTVKTFCGYSMITREFRTERGAKAYITRKVNEGKYIAGRYAVADEDTFRRSIEQSVVRVNSMTGKEFSEPLNTPNFCSPSSEAYWCM